jgi:protein TonB
MRADVKRLIALDCLNKNEGPYLLAELEAPLPSPADKADRDAQPLIRIPPLMSRAALDGNKSGHCLLKFDVSKIGVPKNVRVGYCTDERFRDSSIRSLEKWKYNPAIRAGQAVERKDVVTNIRYVIQDSCGTILPE